MPTELRGSRSRPAQTRLGARYAVRMGTCERCGTALVKPDLGRPQTRFCSRACKDAVRAEAQRSVRMAKRVGRLCTECGNAIPEDRNNRAKTCSRQCGIAYQNRIRQEAKRAAWEATKPPCVECGGEIPSDRHAGSLYCSPGCKKKAMDARWRERWPHYMRQYLYGLSPDRYEELMLAQDGRCAICRSDAWPGKGNRPHVDHDHATGKVRGLLCASCNNGLGRFADDPERLRAAADYLERNR